MKMHLPVRLLSLLLVVALMAGIAVPVNATGTKSNVTFTQVDNSEVSASLLPEPVETETNAADYAETDIVRVSIFLEDRSTIEAGFSIENMAQNTQARAYRARLQNQQTDITAAIEKKIGSELDVVWNLTLAANVISANVPYGQLEAIEAVKGVDKVLIETCYEPQVLDTEEEADPNMATSSKQIGSAAAWAAGYTGAGSRIAVIDTGADTDHMSLNATAFLYSLERNAEKNGMSAEAYIESLNLLDAEEIEKLSSELNASTGAASYINAKIAYGYNYVDRDLDITHDNDSQGSHGSHVSGIATANAYLSVGDEFLNALENAMLQGVAPDAQLITMKVFGKTGGAYDSDYMAAIEDAIILGCDAANLSLGTASPGNSRHATPAYQEIMENLIKSGMVVVISAGNAGSWVENAENGGYLYAEDANMTTSGAPGSFTNSLAVASVDNDGATGYYIAVGDTVIVYNDSDPGEFTNEPFTTLAGEREYILIDGVGTPEDFAAVGEALEGKIALCSRGQISFYEKARNAVDAGAIATIIYDNQPGIVNMDLTDYPYTQPAVSLTQKDGNAIRNASAPVTDETGKVLYYTGTMTVSSTLGSSQYDSEYYTMSSFSSWGVPGSLEMKPEITAPGGSIYSINGVHPSGAAYEVMSGTSMAAPQVTGMTAVVAQYIRENDLIAKTGLTERQLTQSLLMSTAVPLEISEGVYWPILQQGAGLANVSNAISADSYITMADGSSAGAADGKVKVELGDDPARDGKYSASFTINNLTDEEKNFNLSADFFIQAPISDGVHLYMDTSTILIGADVTWTVDGKKITPVNMTGKDINGDGVVNSDDGQAILDYATGVIVSLANIDAADMDTDGDVDSYDAYLFLNGLTNGQAIVPAGGRINVTVEFSLSDSWKETLDYYYSNGTYIQGYIYAESAANDEGVAGTSHSIPVLGFYGSWTDPSMFDVGCWPVYATGEETRIPYVGITRANDYMITFADDPMYYYSFGGNPVIPDKVYMPERNAINSADIIGGVSFLSIRNAAASRFLAVNETTGEVLRELYTGAVNGAYFHESYGMWQNTGSLLEIPVSFSSASEGDVISMGLTLAPEYYVDAEGNVDWDSMSDGATLGMTMVIDNTAPILYEVSLNLLANTMTVTASDNEYIAAVGLYNKAGTRIVSATGAKENIDKGEIATYTFSLDEVNGKKFLLQVIDYAMNKSTYLIEMQIGEEQPLPEMIGFDMAKVVWTHFTKDFEYNYKTGLPVLADSDDIFYAATIAEHYIFASTDTGDLYVMPEDDLTDITFIVNLGTTLTDMAYNMEDGNIYGVDDKNNLVVIDKLSGVLTKVGTIGVNTNTLACDANGTFFCNGLGTGTVYSFTLDTMDSPEILVQDVGIQSQYVQAMEINPNTGMLCWTSFYKLYGIIGYSYYYEIDPNTGEFTQYNDFWHEITCLAIPVKASGDDSWTQPTDKVTGLSLSKDSVSLLKGGNTQLTANVHPWTATDRTVSWSTADATVATVNSSGVITGVGVGTTTITATSNLDPSVSASCTVTVKLLEVTINGTLQDTEGTPMFYSWNMATDDTWTAGAELETSMTSATYSTKENVYYITDSVTDTWGIHKVGADGKTIATANNPNGIPLWDMAYSAYFSEVRGVENVSSIYYYYLLSPKDPMAMNAVGFNLGSYVSYLTGITSMGHEVFVDDDVTYDTEHLVMVDSDTDIWNFWIYDTENGGMSAFYSLSSSDLPCEFMGDDTMDNMYTSLVVGDDGALYLSTYTGKTNELYRLVYDEEEEMYISTKLGDMGDGVWPATITSVTVNSEAEDLNFAAPAATHHMKAENISAEELAAAEVISRTATFTMTAENEAAKAELLAAETVKPNSGSTVTDEEKTVTVNITAPEAATNGVATVSWDAEALTLEQVTVFGDYTAKAEADGSVTFGYVTLEGIAADATIATFVFKANIIEDTTVTVAHKQLNNAAGTTEEVPVTFEHANTEIRDAKAATCTENGYTGDTWCLDCGQMIEQGTVIPATGHSFGEWVVTKAPTCTEDGEKTRTCAACGDVETEVIAKTDCPSAAFTDLDTSKWYHEGTDFVLNNGLMYGMSKTEFQPNGNLTRAQLVAILYRMAGSPSVEGLENPFEDVAAGTWYTDAVIWAYHENVVAGTSETTFAPNVNITREQIAAILFRYSGAEKVEEDHLSDFTDADKISGYAVDAMNWAVANGLIAGMGDGTVAPRATATRAQIASILMRYCNQ